MNDLSRLLTAFGLTLAIEYPIVQLLWIAIKDKEKSKFTFFKNKFVLLPVFIVNILTNPALNIFAKYLWRKTNLTDDTIWLIITILEFFIWAIEAILYKFLLNTKWSKAFVLAITANFVSYLSSFLL